MRVYLSGRYSRRLELAGLAGRLVQRGHEVTATWLLGGHDLPEGLAPHEVRQYQAFWARTDLADIDRADCLIAFTEPTEPKQYRGRGGRHVELGYALGTGKRVIVVGQREHAFCCHPSVEFETNFGGVLARLGQVEAVTR